MLYASLAMVDHARAINNYRHHAAGYDASCERTQPLRAETIGRLALKPGDVVLDVGSGTGMSFEMLLPRVGPDGRLLGVELSPDMMALARRKVADGGHDNVALYEGAIEDISIDAQLDAVLCFYTHDVMRSEAALKRIFALAKPGARVAVAGMKTFPWYLAALNLYTYAKAYPYMTTFEGLAQPWDLLEAYVPDLQRRTTQFGMGYIAWGHFAG